MSKSASGRVVASRVFVEVTDEHGYEIEYRLDDDGPRAQYGGGAYRDSEWWDWRNPPAHLEGRTWWLTRTDMQTGYDPDTPSYWWTLHDEPQRTNLSHEVREHGWLGSDSLGSVTAFGEVRVRFDSEGRVHWTEVTP